MRRRGITIILYTVVITIWAVTITPLVWMISASFMSTGEASTFPIHFFPNRFTLQHYADLFTRLNLAQSLLNSFVLSLSVTLISLVINSLAGYAFAKFSFPGKDKLFRTLLSALVIPAQVTMLPLFLFLNKLGLINTYAGVIIPGLASVFGIFLIRQYAMAIPSSLIEAARMDGAGDFRIYLTVILPLCKPILMTLAIFTFMGTWNDFLWPLIIMTDESMYTLPVALAGLVGEHVQDTELMMAGSVLTVLPVMVIFVAMQKYYIEGIMMGSVKG